MKQKKSIKTYLLVIMILYISSDTLLFGSNMNPFFVNIHMFFIFILGLRSSFNIVVSKKKFYRYYSLVFFIIVSFLLTALVNMSLTGGFILQLLIFLISLNIVQKNDYDEFVYVFEKTIYFFAFVSLLFYILFVLNIEFPIYYIMENTAGNVYKHFAISAFPTSHYSIIPRNASIFREPGVFMIYILFALLISVFNKNISNKHYILYYITLLTTFSTAGIILGMIIMGLQLLYCNIKYKYLYLMLLIFPIVFFIDFSASDYYDKIFGKFNENDVGYGSWVARLSSFTVPFHIFASNIITGVGFDNFTIMYQQESLRQLGVVFNASGMSTNYIMNMFAKFGFFIGLFVLYSLYSLSRQIAVNCKSKLYEIFIFAVICASFSNEDICSSLIFNVFIFYGFKKTKCVTYE